MKKDAVIKHIGPSLLFVFSMANAAGAAAGNWYAGGDVVTTTSDLRFASGETSTFKTTHLRAKGGFEITEWLAVEGHAMSPADDDQTTLALGRTEYELGPMAALFAKPHLQLGPLDFYALLGYSRAEAAIDCASVSNCYEYDTSLEGIAYGAGLQFFATDRIRISADYMVYYDDDTMYDDWFEASLEVDHKNTAIGIGLNFAFK